MTTFLQDTAHSASHFFNKFCYCYQCKAKLLILYAHIFFTPSLLKGFFMNIYVKLLEHSLKTKPQMPIEYHLETLFRAARLIGDKR